MTSPSAHGYDLSTVPLMGAYPATQCPVRTQFKYLPPEGVTPAPVNSVLQAAFDAGNDFEALMFARITDLHPDTVHIEESEDLRAMTAATVEAMDRQIPIILGGCLPADFDGRRTGKPDVLLFDRDGYLPVDVKLYALLKDVEVDGRATALTSSLEAPRIDAAQETTGTWGSSRKKAAFQLAHYWRMLEACGRASSRGAFGGILDANEFIVWIDLNAPDGSIQNKKTYEDEPVTWLRAYDHEFEFRRDVAADTMERKSGVDREPKVLPVWISECSSCEWNVHCRPELEERDHISLLPFMSYWQYRPLRLAGITTRRQIAERDYFTASVVQRLSAAQLKAALDDANGDAPLAELWKRAASIQPFAAELAAAGTVTAQDLKARLTDQLVLDLDGALNPTWIDQARASVLGTPLLARGFTNLDLPTYDVEVDFDMENDLNGNVYMWGLLVSRDGDPQPYQVTDAYEPDIDDGSGARLEAEVFLRFWAQVQHLLAEATNAGKTFQMFYWTGAELTQAKRIAELGAIEGLPGVDHVEAFFGDHCTDLEAVLRKHFVTANGTSVKVIAPLAGHDWSAVYALAGSEDDAAAGGDVSMIKHRLAVESEAAESREAAITWLRTYNEADVEATRKVREWMRTAVHELPRADDDQTLGAQLGSRA